MRGVLRVALCGVVAAGVVVAPVSGAGADEVRDGQWWLEELDLHRVHEEVTRGEGVRIGVIDSGVDASHPDLENNVVPGMDSWEPAREGFDDDLGHGTGVASLAAGHGHGDDGGEGVLGVAPEAEIVPVRVFPDGYEYYGGHADQQEAYEVDMGMVDGMYWLVDEADVDVIMIALGGSPFDELEDAVEYVMENHDVPVVAGIGNKEQSRDENDGDYPAAYEQVFSVSATESGGQWWDGSVEPAAAGDDVLVSAPGAEIASADAGDGYSSATSGTSNATGVAAGVVALMKYQWPDMEWEDLQWRLGKTADHPDGDEVCDDQFGCGIVNPYEALTASVDPPEDIPYDQINPEPYPRAERDDASGDDEAVADGDDAALTADDGGVSAVWWIAATSAGVLLLAAATLLWWQRRRAAAKTASAWQSPPPS